MKGWLFGSELLQRWDCTPTELLGYMKAGLIPYDDIDRQIFDIDTLPRKKLFDENGNSNMMFPFGDEIPTPRSYTDYRYFMDALSKVYTIEKEKQLCLDLPIYGDEIPVIPPGHRAIKFIVPIDRDEALTFLEVIKSFRFKYQDVIGFEQNHGICLIEQQNKIAPTIIMTMKAPVKKKLTPAQQDKEIARQITDVYLQDCLRQKSLPSIKAAVDLVKERHMKKLYADQTIHDWIKDLFPPESRKPGRPKKPR